MVGYQRGRYYASLIMRLAVEMGLHQIRREAGETEFTVQTATYWGAFALDQ